MKSDPASILAREPMGWLQVIGVGRGSAALGPIIAGLLFAGATSLAMVSLAMASGSLIAAVALLLLGRRSAAQV